MALSVDPYLIVAVVLLLLGVIGSVAPLIPGALLSVTGVLFYWWSTGYTEPSTLFVVAIILVGGIAMLFDYFAGAISARAGGASWGTTVIAAVTSLLLLFIVGPLGIIIGVAGTVFLIEYHRTNHVEGSARAAVFATAGVLASTVIQFVITLTILLAFVLTVAI